VTPAGDTSVPAASTRRHTDVTVRVDLEDRDLAGELLVDGRLTDRFHGWVELLAALDRTLDTLQVPDARRRGGSTPPQPAHDD
jgi:hypothetical protein